MTTLNEAMLNVIQGRGDIREVSKAMEESRVEREKENTFEKNLCPICQVGILRSFGVMRLSTGDFSRWSCDLGRICNYSELRKEEKWKERT